MSDLERIKALARKTHKKKAAPARTMFAVKYTRVSSKGQEDNYSLTNQHKTIDAFAEKNGYEIKAAFGGTYESADTDERKEFARMMSFIKSCKDRISYILVLDYTRFSRSGANAIGIANELKNRGISIMAVMQPVDSTTSSGELHQNVLLAFAQFDNSQRKEKCMSGMKEAMRAGTYFGNTPFGYDKTTVNGKQVFEINPQGRIIRKAFIWKAQEKISNVEIVQRLRAEGLPKMYKQQLSRILSNPFYCGYLSNGMLDGELVQGTWEALVTPELWAQANGVSYDNRRGKQKNIDDEFLPLRRFIICSDCGGPMTGYIVKKKWIHYYKCNTPGCKCNRNAEAMHEQFKQLLFNYSIAPKYVAPLQVQLKLTYENHMQESVQRKRELRKSMTELQEKIDKMEERYAIGELDKVLFDKHAGKMRQELFRMELDFQSAEQKLSNLGEYINFVLKTSSNLSKVWELADYYGKRQLQNMLFPEGIQYDKKQNTYRTTKVNEFYSLISSFSIGNVKEKAGQTWNISNLSRSVDSTCLISNFWDGMAVAASVLTKLPVPA